MKLLRKSDLILLLVVCGLCAAAIWLLSAGEGRIAVIEADGQAVRRVDLDAVSGYTEFTVTGETGIAVVLAAGPEGIRFVSSGCAGKQCVNAGWLTKKGQSALCLPARVGIRIEGGNVDAVTG